MAQRGTIDDFKANVAGDFARPNLFQVDLILVHNLQTIPPKSEL